MSVTYPQLDETALRILREQVQALGSIAAVGRALGYSRPAISSALTSTYRGDTRTLRARIVEIFGAPIHCPHLDSVIQTTVCAWWRTRPCPTAHAGEVSHWLACKTCPLNPEHRNPASKEPVPCSA